MDKKGIEDYRIISTQQLAGTIEEGLGNLERFCFILGSGASVSSNIPMGGELERMWMDEMEEKPGMTEISSRAEKLRKSSQLDYEFEEIEKAWRNAKDKKAPLPSRYYFDIYKLRFFPNHRNGYHYLEKIMAGAKPSLGYYPLALMLTKGDGNNLVITTNFDSLVEDALFLYTDSKPLVINHELLAEFAGDSNIRRPIVAKVHRGIFFDPLNKPEETDELKGKWHDVLVSVFQNYTPIVIGYGGGDNSLMELLKDENVKMKNGIYWCYVEEYGLPDEKIQELVNDKKGYFVRTAGFDDTMMTIGNTLFPDKMDVHEIELYLNNRTSTLIESYIKQSKEIYDKLDKKDNTANDEQKQSEEGFREEIKKIIDREEASGSQRQESDRMTAWDYWRQGNKALDLKQYENAVSCFSDAIKRQSNVAQFYFARGYAYGELDKYEDAVLDYTRAIELKSDYAEAYNNRGIIYRKLNEYEKALSDYNKAIELKPDYVEVYNNRGHLYNNLDEYEKTLSDFNRAIELKSDYAEVYNNRGIIYRKLNEYEKAVLDYNRAIELKPDYAEAYINRGNAYNELGKCEEAISDYNKAIELKPDIAGAYNNRGNVRSKLGKYDEAISDYNRAIELKLDNAGVYSNRGDTYKAMGEYKKAVSDYNRAIELNPRYKEAYAGRAEVYRLMNNPEKAEADEKMAASLE